MSSAQKMRDGMREGTATPSEFHEFMKTEGGKIDPRSADVTWWYANVFDPYGLGCAKEHYCVGRVFFARALGSPVWVEFGDLPDETCRVLWKRLESGKPPMTVPFDLEVERVADSQFD